MIGSMAEKASSPSYSASKAITVAWSLMRGYRGGFSLAILAMLPPVIVVIVFQSWFIKGLVESDK